MSKDRKKLLHIHSSVNDKQPTPATLEIGELGVNNAKGNAFISTKNSNGEVVRFSEDETIIGWMEQKEVFPYEGYVRGADDSQVDGVTEQDLLNNKSNIIIKLNQVVPENTDYSPYDEKVNGAKDIYGNLINPISASGYTDGAGIAIDMSHYAMQGANPSFSSITTDCHATFNGTTEIKGDISGDCGSEFDVDVENVYIDASDAFCVQSDDKATLYGAVKTNVGINCDDTATAATTSVKGGKVIIDASTTSLGLTAKQDIIESSEGNIMITANDAICETAGDEATFYGVNVTRVGITCDGQNSTDQTEIGGDNVSINADDMLCESGDKSYFYGVTETNVGKGCDGSISSNITYWRNTENTCNNGVPGFSSNTVDNALHEVYDRSKVTVTSSGNTAGIDVPVPASGTSIIRSGSTTYTLHQDVSGCDNTYNFTVDDTIVSMSAKTNASGDTYSFWQYIGDRRVEIGKVNVPINEVPTCVRELDRHKITFNSGDVRTFSSQTYDPGSDCSNTAETINIPTSITHLKEWNNGCLEIPGCAKATTFYQTSDRNAKDNITSISLSKMNSANNLPIVKFNFKDDPSQTDMYGVIAQHAEGLGLKEAVITDENGRKSVDYTSIIMLKLAYLENENRDLKAKLLDMDNRLKKLENKD